MKKAYFAFLAAILVLPAAVFAAGAHDPLGCTGCHSIHVAKGEVIFAVEANKKALNPKTKQPSTGTTALCLACHEAPEKGGMGIMPVSASMSHPFGIAANPKVASVPQPLLRDGKLECVGCHDPHPSNTYYKYLRVDTARGAKMQVFCSLCHVSKSGVKVDAGAIFDSMDERAPGARPASEPPKEKPTAPKPAR